MEKTALVVGLGISGRAALRFLSQAGYKVFGVDKKDLRSDPTFEGVKVFTEEDFPRDQSFSQVVVSSGIPFTHPIVKHSFDKGMLVTGEVELGFFDKKQRAVAITGTNGKTTVAMLVEHVLSFLGMKAKAIGNIGLPVSEYFLNPDPEEVLVVELSSYQLESLNHPFFDAAAIVNITPDHLDRYDSFLHYAKSKARIQNCLKKEGELYLDPKLVSDFSSLFTKPYQLFADIPVELEELSGGDRQNVQAALTLCMKLGISCEDFVKALKSFKKPSHRVEFVKKIKGVSYFDDSKGTNVAATVQAVESLKGDVIVIVGGVDKGSSYEPWKEGFLGKVKQVFALGEAAERIYAQLSLFLNVKIVDSLERAVHEASQVALEGDSVLLSPGCSSFDMFRDYAHRGREFQKFVALLEGDHI